MIFSLSPASWNTIELCYWEEFFNDHIFTQRIIMCYPVGERRPALTAYFRVLYTEAGNITSLSSISPLLMGPDWPLCIYKTHYWSLFSVNWFQMTHSYRSFSSYNLIFKFCWPCISLQILGNDQLDALFRVFIYFMSLHVSSVTAFIIRRSNWINTSSGMISLCKWLLGMPVRREI